MTYQKIFSRLPIINKWSDSTEKVNEEQVKTTYIKTSLSWFDTESYDYQNDFAPPPPKFVSDGLTTCDLCGWARSEKNFHLPEGEPETSNDFMWILLLIVVSFCSAFIGAIVMIATLKYRRSNSIRAYAGRTCAIKKQDFSPKQRDQKQQQKEMNTNSNIDLKFFMEENTENDDAFYETLNDQDSINSDNMTTYPKFTKSDENGMPIFSSAPSSAYYSDLSNPTDSKQYECIDNFESFDKSEYNKGFGNSFITLNNNNVLTNRLSAISENNFSSTNRDVNSDYV